MKEKIFTFWEGKMPSYIQLCMQTWKFDYVLLNYNNLHEYTDLNIKNIHGVHRNKSVYDRLKEFSLPKIADFVRVHVLRDNGGYWLDADTIMLSDELPKENMIGNDKTRANTIGFLHTESHTDMYNEWSKHQDDVVFRTTLTNDETNWNVLGNLFTDNYLKFHNEITIADVTNCWAETYMIKGKTLRSVKYNQFYFEDNYKLSDLRPTNMLMLHNSWTPDYYKQLTKSRVLDKDCTLSNILREIL